MDITDILTQHSPETPFLVENTEGERAQITVADFLVKQAAIQHHFSSLSSSEKLRIAFIAEKSIASATVLLSLLGLPITLVLLSPHMNEKKTRFFLSHAEIHIIVCSNMFLAKQPWLPSSALPINTVEELCSLHPQHSTPRPSSIHSDIIIYTSGTSGNPKGVVWEASVLEKKIDALRTAMKFSKGKHFLSLSPLFSGAGLLPGFLVPLASGCIVYLATVTPWIIPQFWQLVTRNSIAYTMTVPSVLALLKNHAQLIPSHTPPLMESIISGSAPLPQSLYDWYKETLGISLRLCYGLTECLSIVFLAPLGYRDPLSSYVGNIVSGTYEIRKEDGHPSPPTTIGEVWIHSPCIMKEYYANPLETENTVHKGWVQTGDLGYSDIKGNVYIVGRKKHTIIRKGFTIYPTEIDEAFRSHPQVKDVCTFGVPHDQYGEQIVTALILESPSGDYASLHQFAADHLPPYLRPDTITCVASFPLLESGKIDLHGLRALCS